MKFFQKRVGSIFIVPLFLPSEYTDNIKSYASVDFPPTERYAFGRLIEVDESGGDFQLYRSNTEFSDGDSKFWAYV